MPAWIKASKKLAELQSNARVIALSTGDSYTTVQYARRMKLPFAVAPFPSIEMQKQYGVTEVPLTVVVDAKGKPLPENNWVWSPQGAVNMHMPERWGYVQFSSRNAGAGSDAFTEPVNQQLEWTLRRFYYRQVDFLKANGRYARTLRELATDIAAPAGFQLHATDELYVMTAPGVGGTVHLRQDGRLWTIPTASRRQP